MHHKYINVNKQCFAGHTTCSNENISEVKNIVDGAWIMSFHRQFLHFQFSILFHLDLRIKFSEQMKKTWHSELDHVKLWHADLQS